MNASEVIPWLNIPMLLYCVGMLISINSRLATIEAKQVSMAARLQKLDGINA